MNARCLSFIAWCACVGLVALPASAALADEVDPPASAARLSYLAGAVSVQPAGVDQWTAAIINRPLTGGDQLWSDRGSRAEIELGAATVSLAQNSSVTLLNVGDDAPQLQLSAGSIDIALRELDPSGWFEIDAPNAAVALVRPGSYRIDVDAAGDTTVAMRAGQAQVTTSAGQSISLRAGQGAQFGPNGNVDVAALGAPDDFDRWCAQREQRRAQDQDAGQYVASDVPGAQELGDYGDWREDPDYGYVWYPTAVAVDWAPYSYGRWLWVTPWGWTWVDSAPWGYAPFHYGRWAYLHQRWGWVPAPPRSHAVYAPALVAWVGGPGGGGVSAGVAPGVGWLPLAPGEVYLPGYRVSARYLHDVNASNTTIGSNSTITSVYQNPTLQNRYANQNAPRALTVVSQTSFASGQSVAGRTIAPEPQWQAAGATPRPPAIVPARQSVLGPAPPAGVRHPPVAIANRPVIARRNPPPPPASFDRQVDAMRANGGLALPPAALQQLRGPGSARPNIVLAPQMRAPLTPAPPRPPPMPERHVMPVTPVGATPPGEPQPPAPSAPPIDRRFIPERSPQSQPPLPARPQVNVQQQPPPPPREIEPLPMPAPPPKAPPPPPVQPPPNAKPAPQLQRPEIRKGEPN